MKRMSLYALLATLAISTTGCEITGGVITTAFNFSKFWGTTPLIPVSPYYSQKIEDTYHEEERYGKVPVLDPVEGDNAPLYCLDPPTSDEVIRALPEAVRGSGGFAFLAEKNMNNVRIVVEPIVDRVDECRFYPLVGPARLHHCHYKCTVYFDKTIRSDWPVPFTHTDQSQEVVYIDHDHLIRCAGPQTN
ncbi:MAG: hypothetical protein ACYTGL_11330 [Planctomycetota bacterium]